jgi:hypothetical protein
MDPNRHFKGKNLDALKNEAMEGHRRSQMAAGRLEIEARRFGRTLIADPHHFNEEQVPNPDPHLGDRLDPDPHLSEKTGIVRNRATKVR